MGGGGDGSVQAVGKCARMQLHLHKRHAHGPAAHANGGHASEDVHIRFLCPSCNPLTAH